MINKAGGSQLSLWEISQRENDRAGGGERAISSAQPTVSLVEKKTYTTSLRPTFGVLIKLALASCHEGVKYALNLEEEKVSLLDDLKMRVPARSRSRSEGAIRATLTRTSSASSLLRARRAVFPSVERARESRGEAPDSHSACADRPSTAALCSTSALGGWIANPASVAPRQAALTVARAAGQSVSVFCKGCVAYGTDPLQQRLYVATTNVVAHIVHTNNVRVHSLHHTWCPVNLLYSDHYSCQQIFLCLSLQESRTPYYSYDLTRNNPMELNPAFPSEEVDEAAVWLGEPGSIPGKVAPGFSRVGIVTDDAVGRLVFSGISRFPSACIPALLHTSLRPHGADLPWRSRLVRHRSGVREALGSNPGQGMGVYHCDPGVGRSPGEWPTILPPAKSRGAQSPFQFIPEDIEVGALRWPVQFRNSVVHRPLAKDRDYGRENCHTETHSYRLRTGLLPQTTRSGSK
ncbi:hypothetical protein PR048_007192 [Dryococelus australis]|uniref:Uncharacterized protein n=1 Tax=Dryococelus australis TaxID=614101 RepID=A0ABQ9IE92_9NEOP|nr:hypothetical protein PR048_007192 [Dryococelus australis]